jgi:hypothetical protein
LVSEKIKKINENGFARKVALGVISVSCEYKNELDGATMYY